MLCENCEKNAATTHIRQVINGNEREYLLCGECAAKFGVTSMMNPFAMSIGDMLGSMLGQAGRVQGELPDERRCKGCGATFSDIRNSGMAGCAECYTTFYNEFMPSLQRIHGQTEHIGKVPGSAGLKFRLLREIKALQDELKTAVSAQDFERASVLRDRIRELQAKEGVDDE